MPLDQFCTPFLFPGLALSASRTCWEARQQQHMLIWYVALCCPAHWELEGADTAKVESWFACGGWLSETVSSACGRTALKYLWLQSLILPNTLRGTESASRAATPPSYLAALRELESPVSSSVLNLAATLTTQAEDDADAENLRFLRSPLDPQDEWRAENARERLRRTSEEQSDDRERHDRFRRVMSRLSRQHEPPAYGDRIPSQNNLYDWSPANEADGDEELEQLLQELGQRQPSTHPDILRELARSQLDAERESRRAYSSRLLSSNQPSQTSESSLRSAAILQSVRRHPRFSARTRDYMHRYISDRDSADRATHDGESRDRRSPSRSAATSTGLGERSRYEASRHAWQAQQQLQRSDRDRAIVDRSLERDRVARRDYRREYLENPSSYPASTSPWLEQTIKYLSRLRSSNSYEDSLGYAVDGGFVNKDFFGDDHDDFILDTSTILPPAETSWLAPGAVLSGSQHATNVTSTLTPAAAVRGDSLLYHSRNADSTAPTLFDGARPSLSHNYIPPYRRSGEVVTTFSPQQDRWPVKVTIHAVDYDTMSLSATMEAYNVPSHPQSFVGMLSSANNSASSDNPTPIRTSSITTYLEGEILDFRTHTLLTESFKSSSVIDATYWRKLPPFSNLTDDELVHKLVSQRWMEQLSQEWILMRWKERCFVKNTRAFNSANPTPTDLHPRNFLNPDPEDDVTEDGCGLTISGFYYVCLRRSDGAVEGLYYDPQSSPYQHLKLVPVSGGVFPKWEFR
ncbi:hypothetical protein BU16DRAFT_555297 [Lophium mytilinum]|uniref:Vacuolar import and degradation protein-domain-containing protein n=1 Tax=Lophium mytilinum TaxID=390894 RepID=A0A6A6RHN2_9PEZI|nr:hypothetical protein BU16DRAFT_555297 [Lophium mytilinum]